jgi:acetyltransferase-like isoleucine patch superfamily enzyme
MPIPRASQALSRFTVLDLTRVRSGPTCVRQLADWGANVIKIDALMEDAGGDQPGGPRQGSDFQNLHRKKRRTDCVTGDFTHVSVNATVAGRSQLGSLVFLGTGFTVIDNRSVPDGTVCGAGTVVTRSLAVSGIYVGMPASLDSLSQHLGKFEQRA